MHLTNSSEITTISVPNTITHADSNAFNITRNIFILMLVEQVFQAHLVFTGIHQDTQFISMDNYARTQTPQ